MRTTRWAMVGIAALSVAVVGTTASVASDAGGIPSIL